MEISQWLAIASGLVLMIAYVVYNWGMFAGRTNPNVATWSVWAAIVVLGTSSYTVASGDVWMAVIALANSIFCIATFVVVAVRGRFKGVDRADLTALGLGILAAVSWAVFRSAASANLIVQAAIIIGFVPTWRGLWRGLVVERPLPWWLWSAAYVLALVVVIMRWNGEWVPLVYPINCIWLHASVPLFKRWFLKQVERAWARDPKFASLSTDLGLLPRVRPEPRKF